MDKFPETFNQSRLNHEEIENLNMPIMWEETESVIKKFLTQKSPDKRTLLVNSTQNLENNTHFSQILLKN